MGVDTTTAKDHPSTNALDSLPDDLLDTPPAYLSFGTTPGPVENPPNTDEDDIRTYVVRVRCTGEHGPLKRNDGEVRYKRDLQIQAIWKLGDPAPPDPDADQPGLYDEHGDPSSEAMGDAPDDINDGVDRPGFSDADQ